MRIQTSKDGDLLSYFVKNEESEAEIRNSSLKQIHTNSHTIYGEKLKYMVNYHWNTFLDFVRLSENNKNLKNSSNLKNG